MTRDGTRRLAAVCSVEIEGFADVADDAEAAKRVTQELQRAVLQHAGAHDGRPANFKGETAVAVFDNADAALRAGLAVHDAFAAVPVARERGLASAWESTSET